MASRKKSLQMMLLASQTHSKTKILDINFVMKKRGNESVQYSTLNMNNLVSYHLIEKQMILWSINTHIVVV